MKKTYKTPSVNIEIAQATQILAVSLDKNETGADEGVVLTKENDNWDDIWDE